MQPYLDLLKDILDTGTPHIDRTGVGTLRHFGRQKRFDLSTGFPLLTTKKVFLKGVIHELLWMLSGDTNIKYLQNNGVRIWDDWADENGDLGPVYGQSWRSWKCPDGRVIDQIANVVEQIKTNPNSRRLIVDAWNPADIDELEQRHSLPPCHCLFQFSVMGDKLSCHLFQRSGDTFLGIPFNIASYALLTMMIAQVTNLQPGEFIHTYSDVHIYVNHIEQVKLQLSRSPRQLPVMEINPDIKSIFDFRYEDFELFGYNPYPSISAKVAV